MRVYVTGATGFVGRWLCRHLADHDHTVIESPPSAVLSLSDAPGWLAELSQARPDVVIHLAAVSRAAEAQADPQRALVTNVAGTWTLLDSVAALDPQPAVLLVSSAEIYGELRRPSLITEIAPLLPRHIYGASKLAQEGVALWAAAQRGTNVLVVRPFNHTGPGQRDDFVVPALVKRVLAVAAGETDEVVVGNLDVARDIGDVRDVVRAYRLLAEALGAGVPTPDVYNVATGRAIVLRDLLVELCRIVAVQPRIRVDPELVRSNDPAWIAGDASKLRSAIGWRPEIPIATTIADMVQQA